MPTLLTTEQVFCVPTNVSFSYGYWESRPGHSSAPVTLLTVPSNTDSLLVLHPPLHTGSVLVSLEQKATACVMQLFKAGTLGVSASMTYSPLCSLKKNSKIVFILVILLTKPECVTVPCLHSSTFTAIVLCSHRPLQQFSIHVSQPC